MISYNNVMLVLSEIGLYNIKFMIYKQKKQIIKLTSIF